MKRMKQLLLLTFVASAVSGIGLAHCRAWNLPRDVAQLGSSSCPVEPALACFRIIPHQTALALVSVYYVKRHRQEKPDNPCSVRSFSCRNGYGHYTDCICGRSKLCYRIMALQVRTVADCLFFGSLHQTETKEMCPTPTGNRKKGVSNRSFHIGQNRPGKRDV